MTPEERAVLEAALELDSPEPLGHVPRCGCRICRLRDAVRAYRQSLKPKPRYGVIWSGLGEIRNRWVVADYLPAGGLHIAASVDQKTAERICRLLNEDDRILAQQVTTLKKLYTLDPMIKPGVKS